MMTPLEQIKKEFQEEFHGPRFVYGESLDRVWNFISQKILETEKRVARETILKQGTESYNEGFIKGINSTDEMGMYDAGIKDGVMRFADKVFGEFDVVIGIKYPLSDGGESSGADINIDSKVQQFINSLESKGEIK